MTTGDVLLRNSAVGLAFMPGGDLQIENCRSGSRRLLDWPAFAIALQGQRIAGSEFAPQGCEVGEGQVEFRYRHDASGLTATVRYWLEGEQPWFRKQVSFTAPAGTPTPERVWVDVQAAPSGCHRIGYGIRGVPEGAEVAGLQTYADQPGCGYPVYCADWFIGLESPTGFALPVEGRLELFQHPTWDDEGQFDSFAAVFGAAESADDTSSAFMDYVWHVRRPKLARPLHTVTAGWSTKYLKDGEYLDTLAGRDAFVDALLQTDLRPRGIGIDAGWFDLHSMYRGKDDDENDTRLRAFRHKLAEAGFELAVWVSHNGPVGFNLEWIKQQDWEIGQGDAVIYRHGDYVVMMQPTFEQALTRRWSELVQRLDVVHLKMDWDNECASNEQFAEKYPTIDHVREESVKAFFRIGARLREVSPDLALRHGWWPSPWFLTYADHVWLVDSGDCEYEAWPSRTARDRDATHRDAMYHHLCRTSETPLPLDAYDNHGFADAVCNCFTTERHTWLNTCVLSALRGTTYIHYPLTPEGLRDWQAQELQRVLQWWDFHTGELGLKGTRVVLGRPAEGEVYGFLHPHAGGAWLMLRNPSVEPQATALPLEELGFVPGTVRQVYPHWRDLCPNEPVWLLGHEVLVLQISRQELPEVSPVPGMEFVVDGAAPANYWFPAGKRVNDEIGPAVHPDMQVPELWAETLPETALEHGRRLQWFVAVPHRMEQAELLVTLRGPEDVLEGLQLRAGTSRYRGDVIRDFSPVTRIYRGTRGFGTIRVLPPLGPRDRDDYVMAVPDGGFTGLTVEVTGPRVEEVCVEAWLTGYEGLSRRSLSAPAPAVGPLLPCCAHGFSRFLKLT